MLTSSPIKQPCGHVAPVYNFLSWICSHLSFLSLLMPSSTWKVPSYYFYFRITDPIAVIYPNASASYVLA